MPGKYFLCLPLLWALVCCCGCREDTSIRTYSVAKSGPGASADSEPQPAQLLGMIIPQGESAWFLKLTDQPERVQQVSEDFRSIADSLVFSEDGTPRWTLADGWSEQVLRQITYAQFLHPEGATVTLTQLGANTADVSQWQSYLRENINRWREQLSLAPQDWATMEQNIEVIPQHSTETAKAYFVSLSGTQASGAGGRGPMGQLPAQNRSRPASSQSGPSAQRDEPTRRQLTYQVPEGWVEYPTSGIRLASFEISEGERSAMVTVSTAGGSIDQSVQMWIAQIGVEPNEDRVREIVGSAVRRERVGGQACTTYMVVEPAAAEMEPSDEDLAVGTSADNALEQADAQTVAIRVSVIPLDDRENIFVKMSGDFDLIQSQIEEMDQFVDSLAW